jgi:transcriptional regulator with XRE-family HTH domain
MNDHTSTKSSYILQHFLKKANLSNIQELSDKSGVSELQILRLQNGLLLKMNLEILIKIALGLNISLNELITSFSPDQDFTPAIAKKESSLFQEYVTLQENYAKQQEELTKQFQRSTLDVLESLILQLPTAIAAITKKPDLPAKRFLPLLKPIQKLLGSWNIKAIASVGDTIPYDPVYHQLIEGNANKGDHVEVRYLGYCQGEKLLYRAKVSSCKGNRE